MDRKLRILNLLPVIFFSAGLGANVMININAYTFFWCISLIIAIVYNTKKQK